MPALPSHPNTLHTPQTVLVTGANGYISMWVVRDLLERGFFVVGTVRSDSKGVKIVDALKANAGLEEAIISRFKYTVVEDIIQPGIFDDLVKGVHGIVHLASIMASASDDVDAYIKPIVEGTMNIVRSAWRNGKDLKRIVVTSSCAAINNPLKPTAKVFDETDWADESIDIVRRDGAKAEGIFKYRAAKTLAEKAAWEFVAEHKADISWDLVTLHPPIVIGPAIHPMDSPRDIGLSLGAWYSSTKGENPAFAGRYNFGYPYADVRDVAAAHIYSLIVEAAGGSRFITASGTVSWLHTRDIIKRIRPDLDKVFNLSVSPDKLDQAAVTQPTEYMRFSNEKSKQILGIKYRPIEEIVVDVVADLERKGVL